MRLDELVDEFGIPGTEEVLDELAAPKKGRAPVLTVEDDDSGFVITAKLDRQEAGSIAVYLETGDDEFYFLSPYEEQPWYAEVTEHGEIADIRHLDVEERFRGQGVARALMTRAMKEIKKRWAGVPIFINASPMGESMGLPELVRFYTSFGFRVLTTYPEHDNAALWRDA